MTTGRDEEMRRALLDDPRSDHLDERSLLRDAVASLTGEAPGAEQLAGLDALLTLALPDGGLGLTEREWVETVLAADRCLSNLHALKLAAVAALDQRILASRPSTRHRRDSRRPTADALAPWLKIAPGSASALVGLARQSLDMPAASDALAEGLMTHGQFQVLARVLARMPDAEARARVEAVAVRKAVTAVRAQLAGILEEAATQADPGYVARTTAMGVEERDVRLARSSVPGCQRVIADLERSDAARFWQVLNHVATRAKGTPVVDDATGQVTEEGRTLPQLRADALVSLTVGMFSLMDDEPDDDVDDSDRPADTRAPVRIPTPEDRSKLSELHVVVLADDLDDQPDEPDGGPPPDGPDDGPDDRPVPRPDRTPAGTCCTGTSTGSGADDSSAAAPAGRRRSRSLARFRPMGWLPGYGRLGPDTTAAIVERARWRRLVADPATGVLVQRSSWVIDPDGVSSPSDSPADGPSDRQRERRRRLDLLLLLPAQPPPRPEVHYRPSSGLAAFIRARDATCIGPACHHAARSGGMQLDHTTAWGPDTPTRLRGGPTAHGNLGCVCVRTHDAKTHGGWRLAQPTPGSFVWSSPQGLVARRRATPVVPDALGDLAA